jgi:hypothetical protein
MATKIKQGTRYQTKECQTQTEKSIEALIDAGDDLSAQITNIEQRMDTLLIADLASMSSTSHIHHHLWRPLHPCL